MAPDIIHLKPRRPEGILARLADKAKEIPPLRRFVLRVTKKTPAFRNIIRQCRMFVGGGLSSKELLLPQHNFFREWRDVVSQQEWAARSGLIPISLAPAASCPAPSLTVFPGSDQKKMLFPGNDEIFPEMYSSVIDDAHVIPGSNTILTNSAMIFHDLSDPERQLAPEELSGFIEFDDMRRKARLKSSPETHHEIPAAAHFCGFAAQNYAHWITEILPRIVMFCKIEANKDIPILVDEKLPATIWQSLALAVGPHRKVYVLSPVISVKVKKLHLISVSGYIPFGFRGTIDREALHGKYSPVALASVRELAIESIMGEQVQKALPRKFFIRRKSSSRRLLNQDQIEKIVVAKGFSVVCPEELTFLEQVRLFNNAEAIIGPTGAAFANIIFCNPSAKVTILIADNPSMPYLYWPKLASVAGVDVTYVLGRAEGDASEGVHRDFSVPKETMISFLEEL
jgi:capsular polysaccharide biosynthesis protein